jgi:anti-sigma-K factor RskA
MLYLDVMEPLSPNDPIYQLLGKSKPVEPRPNFTQNVLRAVRQAPQTVSAWERVQEWLGGWSMPRLAVAGAMAAVAIGLAVMAMQKPATQTPVVAQKSNSTSPPAVQPTLLHEVSAAMILAATAPEVTVTESSPASENLDPMGVLLVEQDTSALTNSDLALLAY